MQVKMSHIPFQTLFESKLICLETNFMLFCVHFHQITANTVVPALCDPRHERPPSVYGHVINVRHISTLNYLPSADTRLTRTQTVIFWLSATAISITDTYKQMQRFQWSFQPQIAGAHPNLRSTGRPHFRAVIWQPMSNISHRG